jgi:hypothetical protein
MIIGYIYIYIYMCVCVCVCVCLCYSNNIATHNIILVVLRVGGTNSKFSLFGNVFL